MALNPFHFYSKSASGPALSSFPITPADGADLATDIRAITTAHAAALNTAQVAALNTSQIAALETSDLRAFNTANIAALTTEQKLADRYGKRR